MTHLRYLPSPGNYYADRFGLIGHDEADVAAWRAAHPDYRGGFWFDYADGSEDQIEVTERFAELDATLAQLAAESAEGRIGDIKIVRAA